MDVPDGEQQVFTLVLESQARLVGTVSKGGPSDGAVVLLDCDGNLLDVAEVGYVLDADFRDATGDHNDELVVQHQSSQGTGWREERFTIFRLSSDSIHPVLSVPVFQGSYLEPPLGSPFELRAAVEFLAGARQSIMVTSTRQGLGFDTLANEWRPMGEPIETMAAYCWVPDRDQFLAC